MLLTIIIICIIFLLTDQPFTRSQRNLMYVCLCKGVTDAQIRATVQEGATSLGEVRRALGVATQCGKCRFMTRDIFRESLSELAGENGELCYAAS
jgi:bacterioferritin-associated ferredoxin